MTRLQALKTLERIVCEPSIADQFTEQEIDQLQERASRK